MDEWYPKHFIKQDSDEHGDSFRPLYGRGQRSAPSLPQQSDNPFLWQTVLILIW